MKLITLASGSRGNSTYIESGKRKILIDQGLSFKEIKARLNKLNVQPQEITAIFITHEHIDHIKGIYSFLKNCPYTYVYVHSPNINTIKEKFPQIDNARLIAFDNQVVLDDIVVRAFSVSHDSNDCVGYQISEGINKVAIATDLGYYTQEILEYLIPCSLVVLEANHDVETLIKNPHYPSRTKARILSGKGHLSNDQASEIIYILAKNKVKQIILAHLSEENNSPIIAYSTICNYLSEKDIFEGRDIYIDVSTQNEVGNFFLID